MKWSAEKRVAGVHCVVALAVALGAIALTLAVFAAPARGADDEGLKEQLQQAVEELKLAEARFQAGKCGEVELHAAKFKVALLQAELAGDPAQVAKVRLAGAIEELRLTDARFKAGKCGDAELQAAKFKVALLQAELAGDPAQVAKVRLAGAIEELRLTDARFKVGLCGADELDAAKFKVMLMEVEMTGDPVRVATVRLAAAQSRLKFAQALFEKGQAGAAEVQAARKEVEFREVELRDAKARGAGGTKAADGTLRLYDFEEAMDTDRWGTAGVDMSLSDQHATSGKRSLKVVIHKTGWYSGFAPSMPRDWSGCESLKLDIWCEEPAVLCFRVDDEKSQDWASRYNLDGQSLRKGANTVIIPVADVAARIDVTKVVFFSVFPELDKMTADIVIYLDNVRMVKEEPFDPPGATGSMKTRELTWAREDRAGRTLYDFETPEQLTGWQTRKSADVSISDLHAAAGGHSLKVTLKAGRAPSPQVLPVTPEDWTGYTALEFDVWCEEAMDLTVLVTDPNSGPGKRTFYEERFTLRQGDNTVTVSLDAVGARIDLARVKQFCLLSRNITKDCVFYIDNVRLAK